MCRVCVCVCFVFVYFCWGVCVFVLEKVYFRSQILERPSIGEYWNIFDVPVLPENVIFTFFRTCWCYSEAYNTGTQKGSSIVQYSCTSIWNLKYLVYFFLCFLFVLFLCFCFVFVFFFTYYFYYYLSASIYF